MYISPFTNFTELKLLHFFFLLVILHLFWEETFPFSIGTSYCFGVLGWATFVKICTI